MGRIGAFLLGVVVGAVFIYGGQRYHVVRSDESSKRIVQRCDTASDALQIGAQLLKGGAVAASGRGGRCAGWIWGRGRASPDW